MRTRALTALFLTACASRESQDAGLRDLRVELRVTPAASTVARIAPEPDDPPMEWERVAALDAGEAPVPKTTLRDLIGNADAVAVAMVVGRRRPLHGVTTVPFELVTKISGALPRTFELHVSDLVFEAGSRWLLFLQKADEEAGWELLSSTAATPSRFAIEDDTRSNRVRWNEHVRQIPALRDGTLELTEMITVIRSLSAEHHGAMYRVGYVPCAPCSENEAIASLAGTQIVDCGSDAGCALTAATQSSPFKAHFLKTGLPADYQTAWVGATDGGLFVLRARSEDCKTGIFADRCSRLESGLWPPLRCVELVRARTNVCAEVSNVSVESEPRPVTELTCASHERHTFKRCRVGSTEDYHPAPFGPDLVCSRPFDGVMRICEIDGAME